jgi:hypothetical protein
VAVLLKIACHASPRNAPSSSADHQPCRPQTEGSPPAVLSLASTLTLVGRANTVGCSSSQLTLSCQPKKSTLFQRRSPALQTPNSQLDKNSLICCFHSCHPLSGKHRQWQFFPANATASPLGGLQQEGSLCSPATKRVPISCSCGLDGTSLRHFSAFKPQTLSCLPAGVQNRQARLSSIPFYVFYSICGGTNREVVTLARARPFFFDKLGENLSKVFIIKVGENPRGQPRGLSLRKFSELEFSRAFFSNLANSIPLICKLAKFSKFDLENWGNLANSIPEIDSFPSIPPHT